LALSSAYIGKSKLKPRQNNNNNNNNNTLKNEKLDL
jgi:hypothetical protein